MEQALKRHPAYLQAVDDALLEFDYGDMMPMGWLIEHFDLTKPTIGTAEKFNEYHFAFLNAMDKFREILLDDHSMLLTNVKGNITLLGGWPDD